MNPISSDAINGFVVVQSAMAKKLSESLIKDATDTINTASRLEALASTVKPKTVNAKPTNPLAIGASEVAGKGGRKWVPHSRETMEKIVTSIRHMTNIISEITAASAEQRQGIELLSTAITQMNEVSQQNAALYEQAAVESLGAQAQNLSLSVGTSKWRRLPGIKRIILPNRKTTGSYIRKANNGASITWAGWQTGQIFKGELSVTVAPSSLRLDDGFFIRKQRH